MYMTTNLRIVCYGCESWSLSVSKKHKNLASEDSVMKKSIMAKDGGSYSTVRGGGGGGCVHKITLSNTRDT
jgi:hypothetical protein